MCVCTFSQKIHLSRANVITTDRASRLIESVGFTRPISRRGGLDDATNHARSKEKKTFYLIQFPGSARVDKSVSLRGKKKPHNRWVWRAKLRKKTFLFWRSSGVAMIMTDHHLSIRWLGTGFEKSVSTRRLVRKPRLLLKSSSLVCNYNRRRPSECKRRSRTGSSLRALMRHAPMRACLFGEREEGKRQRGKQQPVNIIPDKRSQPNVVVE